LMLGIFMLIGAWGNVSAAARARHVPGRGNTFWLVFFIYWLTLAVMIGGGSLVNLVRRRLSLWPSITLISGYFLSLWLIPLGIWGIVALARDRKRKRKSMRSAGGPTMVTTSKSHSP
jgi:hypothetical protein